MKLRLALNFIFSSGQWLEELERVFTVHTRTHTAAVYSGTVTVHVTRYLWNLFLHLVPYIQYYSNVLAF